MNQKKGMFIVFEGIDGCGKSTQIKKFADYLFSKDKHYHIILTRNPYKNADIRGILRQDNDPLTQSSRLADLFIEDRKNHANEVVIPNIDKGHFVVSDRYKLSTIAYQSAQGLDIMDLIKRHIGLPIPNITFIFDLPAKIASLRMKNEDNKLKMKNSQGRNEHKFEANLDFLEQTRQNYINLKRLLPEEKIFIIDSSREIEEIFKEITSIFEKELEKH